MAETKTILVLANSTKKGGRCVAGRELIENKDGYTIEDWIRPIDDHESEGTIPERRTIIDGRMIIPLEIIQVPFIESANNPLHPEDWKVDRSKIWQRIDDARLDALQYVEDDANDLWGAGSASTRKVQPKRGAPTLKLVRPQGKVIVSAYKEDTPWGLKTRREIDVPHGGVTHTFSIDDPEFMKRHKLDPNSVGDQRIRFELDPEKTVVVASLTLPFGNGGYQYKIAATIFEL